MTPVAILCKGRPCAAIHRGGLWRCSCCGKHVQVVPNERARAIAA